MATKIDLLKKVLNEVKTKVADDIIVDFSKDSSQLQILCSWGSLLVDQIAPLVKGRIYECYGPYSSGKSSLAICAAANIIKEGGIVVYIDSECAFNAVFAKALGLDITNERFVLIQPETEEDGLAALIKFCNSGAVDLAVLDSTNGLMPKVMLMGEGDDSEELSTQRVGLKAKILNQAVIQLVPTCKRTGTSCIFISQERANISMFGGGNVIGVGKSLEYFASTRIKVVRTGRIEGDLPDGTKGVIAIPVKVQTTKNKIVAPFKEAEIQINVEGPNKGICIESEYTQVAFNMGILVKDNRGILFAEETPLYPNDTPLSSSMPKLNELLGEVQGNKKHPFYWIKEEIELRVKEKLGQITEDEIEIILGPIYEKKDKENEYALKYLELANAASGASKLLEANYYIEKANKYNPFDKTIQTRYKAITKRYNERYSTITDFVCVLQDLENETEFKMDFSTGEVIPEDIKGDEGGDESAIVDNESETNA